MGGDIWLHEPGGGPEASQSHGHWEGPPLEGHSGAGVEAIAQSPLKSHRGKVGCGGSLTFPSLGTVAGLVVGQSTVRSGLQVQF